MFKELNHNLSKTGGNQMSVSWRMDQEIVIHPHKGVPLNNRKEWAIGTCNTVDEAEMHCYNERCRLETYIHIYIRSDQISRSVVSDSSTPWITAGQASLSITNSRSSLRLTSVESMMPSSHLILCRPLLLLPPIPPSIRVSSNESTLCMRWPKYWT